MPSELIRFDKNTGRLYLRGANGEQQIVVPPTNRTVFVLIDASGSMADRKFEYAKRGALDFGLGSIAKQYQVGVVVFSDRTLASSPTASTESFQAKVKKLECTSGGTYLTSALRYTIDHKPAYVLVVTDGQVTDAEDSLAVAQELKLAGTEILTIGTDDADQEFLKQLASRSDLGVKVAPILLAETIKDSTRLLR